MRKKCGSIFYMIQIPEFGSESITPPPSLGVIDHDPLVLYAVRRLVGQSKEKIHLLWTARSCGVALGKMSQENNIPHLILMDPFCDGAAAPLTLRKLRSLGAAVAIMVAGNNRAGMSSDMSGISNCDSEERLINKGALIAEPREVGKVLRRTAEKKRESPIVDGELTGFRSLTTEAEEMLTLSKKEHAVMKMYSRGLTTQSVARKMSIAESTAKTYARRAYRKLGVGSRAEAVTMLAKWGIV